MGRSALFSECTILNPAECLTPEGYWKGMDVRGPFRIIEYQGKEGINGLSAHSMAILRDFKHTLNQNEGSLSVWVFPLEDMTQTITKGNFARFEPNFFRHVIISDTPNMHDFETGSFLLMYQRFWKNSLLAKFCSGIPHDAHGDRAIAVIESFSMKRNQWYQLGLSWKRDIGEFFIYVNGIRISSTNPWLKNRSEPVEHPLCVGNPSLAIGEIACFKKALSPEEFQEHYRRSKGNIFDTEVNNQLRKIYTAEGVPQFEWKPNSKWKLKLDLTFTKDEDLKHFYIQGCKDALNVTDEGLYVETPRNETTNTPNVPDRESQVYLHTWEMFEGDLAVDLEFKYFGETGLALLMLQVSGMQGEDFMKDYPLRTTGSMNMVHQENVRNYHWEFFRLMDGLPSYRASHLLVKNPWLYPLAYQMRSTQLEPGIWHHLQFVQEGYRLRGAVDGMLAFDVYDNVMDQHGAAYHRGHFSLRNMYKTRFVWRNLKLYIRPPLYTSYFVNNNGYND